MSDSASYGFEYPIPTVPINSKWFDPVCYWQGPTWVNTNWLIIDGLRRYGFNDQADRLTRSTLKMVKMSGFYEYFDPSTGAPRGVNNFSWTAALTLDLEFNLN
jgi:glycogen debranching enzyme